MSGFCVKKIGLTWLKLEFSYSWFQVLKWGRFQVWAQHIHSTIKQLKELKGLKDVGGF